MDAPTPVEAGQIYACGKSRYRRVDQVRETGRLRDRAGGLKYALVRVCGPRGRTHAHPYLKDDPITVFLLPDGSMPPGYLLTQGEPEPDAPEPGRSTSMSANPTTTPTTEEKPVVHAPKKETEKKPKAAKAKRAEKAPVKGHSTDITEAQIKAFAQKGLNADPEATKNGIMKTIRAAGHSCGMTRLEPIYLALRKGAKATAKKGSKKSAKKS